MNWVFYAILGAAILHVLEEYLYPGGFHAFMKKMAPTLAPFITASFAVVVNALFLLLCLAAALVGPRAPIFRLSIASLCGFNGLMHMAGAVRAKQYAPGLLTGVLLFLPLAVLAFYLTIRSSELSAWQLFASVLMGLAYQLVPVGTLGVARAMRRG